MFFNSILNKIHKLINFCKPQHSAIKPASLFATTWLDLDGSIIDLEDILELEDIIELEDIKRGALEYDRYQALSLDWIVCVPHSTNSFDFSLYKPEFFLLTYTIYFLLFSTYLRKYYRAIDVSVFIYLSTLLLLIIVGVLLYNNTVEKSTLIFNSALIIDAFSTKIKLCIVITSVLILITSYTSIVKFNFDTVEYTIIICFSVFFLLVLVSSFNMITLWLSLEGLSLLLYVLTVIPFNKDSIEAGIKYFILGAFASGLLLFGISLMYYITGSFDFTQIKLKVDQGPEYSEYFVSRVALFSIAFGFFFKLSLFPCHMWSVDVYEGTSLPVTVFFMTVIKIGVFFFFVRLLFWLFWSWFSLLQVFLVFSCVGSLFIGGIATLAQRRLKRLFIYSSMSQVGFALLGLVPGTQECIQYSFFFFFIYILTTLGIFAVILNSEKYTRGDNIVFASDLRNFGKNNFFISICLALMLLSLAGIPPLAGFYSKMYIFKVLVQEQYYLLTIYAIIISVLNAFAYARLIKCLLFDRLIVKKYRDKDFLVFCSNFIRYRNVKNIKFNKAYNLVISFEIIVYLLFVGITFFLIVMPLNLDFFFGIAQGLMEECCCIYTKRVSSSIIEPQDIIEIEPYCHILDWTC